ncbi:MAG: tRNA (N6-isopentenyl adenosine(37)-C2)-methylthiotransferase MiaB [Phycisphaerae bacterium]|nr:tRNA (N6-isopentenyl adenosine(37)-C2)-methylthiotransferase MiaB [Phycisphaerae bacterium]
MSKRVYLETMGCQMNKLDSELVLGQLCRLGYAPTDDFRRADLVLLNTCSVRQHAEDKVYSRLGEVARIKRERPEMVVGVIGCMAERDHQGIQRKAPHVDLLCGPGNLNQIGDLLAEVLDTRQRAIALEHDRSRRTPKDRRTLEHDSIESLDLSRTAPPDGNVLQAYVRVQRGCDKFCTYCVVPYTRGPERSRPPANIVDEVRKLADMGTREVTLLGQTVNSYLYAENGRTVRFADLLERVHEVGGIERIRFVTSYPGDFTDDILQAMRDLPKVCEYLSLPAQSGSNAVLRRMRRDYTAEQYLELVDKARRMVPGISLSSDFIVGFSGETEEDHQATLALIERIRYKNIFMFKYSNRPNTKADRVLPDDVPYRVKQRRHSELMALQHRLSIEHHRAMIGRRVEVLVEGPSKPALKARQAVEAGKVKTSRRADQLTGHTRGDEIVVFAGPDSLIGRFVTVEVTDASPLTLQGMLAGGPGVSPIR